MLKQLPAALVKLYQKMGIGENQITPSLIAENSFLLHWLN